MIGCFPDPYPDELLYSVLARLSDRLHYPSPKSLLRDLLGHEEAEASIHLPSHLGHLIEVLPVGHGYTVDHLIDQHTLLPVYSPFLPSERVAQLRREMQGNDGRHIYGRIGLSASRIPMPEWLRFCPVCAREDQARLGEYYWHRVHQVPGVEVCPVHAVWLQKSQVRVWNRQAKNVFISADQVLSGSFLAAPEPIVKADEPLFSLAREAAWLLDQANLIVGPVSLASQYRNLLIDHRLASYSGIVHVKKLSMALKNHYRPKLLKLLHCELNETPQTPWPARLIQPAVGVQHPLYHWLLIHFLGHTCQTLFDLPSERLLFGEGPWPCLNPTSDHYRQPVIKKYEVFYNSNSKKPVGTFTCDECGFVYTRVGPETSPEERFQLKAIKSFGVVWDETLQQVWADQAVNLKMAQQQLGVDARTLHQCAARLELPYPKPGSHRTQEARPNLPSRRGEISPRTREAYRAIFLAAKKEVPEVGLFALQQKIPKVYRWLVRNDRGWFEVNKPACKREKGKNPTPNYADWPGRDIEMVSKVKATALSLKSRVGCPVRLTKTRLAQEMGLKHLSYLEYLPQTSQELSEVVETVEEYYVRRVWWTAEYYRQANLRPKRWQLIRQAGVSRRATHPLISAALDAALQMLGSPTAEA